MRSWALASIALTLALPAAGGDGVAVEPVSVVSAPNVDADPTGPSLEDRLEEIRRRIESALVYPPSARQRELEGVAGVEFEIGPDGHARDLELVRPSGLPVLDRAALRAVQEAGTLPYVFGRLDVPIRFILRDRR